MKRSIRTQMVVLQIGLLLGVFLALLLGFRFFLERYYRRDKLNTIRTIYAELNTEDAFETDDDDEDERKDEDFSAGGDGADALESEFSSKIMKAALENNIQILITTSDFQAVISTSRDAQELSIRLFGYYTGFFTEGLEEIESTDQYRIQISRDMRVSLQYLEMWGRLDSGQWFLIRTPLESMKETARLSIVFLIIIGIIAMVVGALAIFFLSKKFTKPITQLTEISKRMANQDFSVKYTGQTQNEIGQLGANFNLMSDELEQTISDLKTANVELQKDMEKKQQLEEQRTEFLNNVSHELKTPLTMIQGYAEGLKDNIAEDPESRDFYCDVIIDESAKMNQMVQKLLTLNQLEFGHDTVQLARFDLTALVYGVARGMQLLLDQAGAEVILPKAEPVWVWGDEFQIEEVLTNYLSNAIHHLGGEKKIEIRFTVSGGIVRTDVFNTGNPIPEEDVPKIWDKFYKVDKARTREYGGSGIGLSIVKAVMEGHKQQYGVQNYQNGVAFYFTLEGENGVK